MDIDSIYARIETCRSEIENTTSIIDDMYLNEESLDPVKLTELLENVEKVVDELEYLISLVE